MHHTKLTWLLFIITTWGSVSAQQNNPAPNPKIEKLKSEVQKSIDKNAKTAQEMVDMVFSFSELGFQETETSAYLTNVLQENGFTIEYGISGIPTAWIATWGTGNP